MRKLMVLACLCLVTNWASAQVMGDEYYTLSSVEMVEIVEGYDGQMLEKQISKDVIEEPSGVTLEDILGTDIPKVDEAFIYRHKSGGLGKFGQIIKVGKELVALGEDIYKLVKKGEAVVNTSYAPVSVLPKTDKAEPVDILDTQGWSRPKTRQYQVRAKNLFGMTTVKFDFLVMFSYGGRLNGKGRYITAAEIIPLTAETVYGYSLDANFRLESIMNHGTKSNPVAGAVMVMSYKLGTILKKSEKNKTFYISGLGEMKAY